MADRDYHWSDHVRMAAVFALLPAMVFVGPLTAILGLAVVLFLLPDGDSNDGAPSGTA
ncbi:hypothetical protein [Natrinema amylolyticum]|uniref:hypothetical protein n=1 Tax=Natrinema amylolyticum TaxID=2878679 RepID=UPI001CFC07C9|nr:hypothetical protein [Natrinema amylolyticum]